MLLSTNTHAWPAPQTPYEAEAVAFCRAWESGQSVFTLDTSGSTGTPKPIRLTRAQMQASARLTGQTLGLQSGDTALVCLNVRYVAGVMMLVRGLELGLSLTIQEPSGNPLATFDPATNQFDFAAFVPLQLQAILEQTPDKVPILNGMKAILVGGAATSLALERALQVITAPVYATYGMTETVSHIALRRLNGPDASTVFTALDGVVIGTDERGCLQITGAATNFEKVQTNDVVDLIDPAHFRLLGRADRIINSGGVKIQPERVEQIVYKLLTESRAETIPRLFVTGLPDGRLGQRVTVISEGLLINNNLWDALQQAVKLELGAYAVPKEWITIPTFAETPTGKVDQGATLAKNGL